MLVVACGPGNAASNLAKPPEFAPKDQTKCGVTKSQAKPLIVEWPSSERGELEAHAKRGLVAVRYERCELEMLPRCRVPGSYKYVAITPKSDELVIRDADDLYASVPLGAAKLESRLSRAATLRVAMTIVGRYEADADEVRPDQLTGDCTRATHFVSALTAGAFDFYAEGKAHVGGKATALGAGVGGDSAAERENITKDGDPSACGGATSAAAKPPPSCGALLRIEVVPFGEAKKHTASCPAGTEWDGTQCMGKKVVTTVDCPRGTTWDGAKCAGITSTECAGGMHFEAGRGCVGNVVPAAVQPYTPRGSPGPAGGEAAVTGMVSIPAGSFMMGSNDGEADEKPVHRVSVASFAMDVTEVTTVAYTACVRAGRCSATETVKSCNYGHSDKDNHPINCVDWDQATAYCASVGKRLPTEEEWEYAARGPDATKYSWGDDESGTRACWNRATEGTCQVGKYPPGAFGLKDMNGNVWEWVASVYSIYNASKPSTGDHVYRGGGFQIDNLPSLRSTVRAHSDEFRSGVLGFRCAK
jgi:formylglycine-generating enzyme required for sulfatase activity